MNAKLFRLVFNKALGMYVPAHEAARTRGKDSGRSAAAALLMLVATLAHGRTAITAPAADALPVPSTTRPFIYSGTGSASTAGTTMTIHQESRTLGLNFASFNIGSAATVNVNQPDAGSRLLNKIWDANPSVIMGRLNANGQVYLLNQNGILFGNGAQVNVGGLVASALSVSDDLLNKGLPGAAGDSLNFTWGGDATGFLNGFVAVDPGARITTPAGGRVVLLAPRGVENLGRIDTGAGGESILAAGGNVLLTAPADPNLRGLLVEVKSWKGVDSLGNNVTLSGEVVNKADGVAGSGNGEIVAPQGVVSLAALAVNQSGAVKAAKAINLNGQIMLVAGPTQADRLTVTQTGDKAEIDWKAGFNVKPEGDEAVRFKSVEFIQPDSGAVAYNFVYDPDRVVAADGTKLDNAAAGRSTIDGKLTANGQWFLVNEKGIDFGANADVTASNLVASALGINPLVVQNGLFSLDGTTARGFYLRKNQWLEGEQAAALAAFRDATVNIADGARIASGSNGFAIIAGGQVDNAGGIATPNGQTILAAGAELYLKPPYLPLLRGFSAEVNPLYYVEGQGDAARWVALSRGADANRVSQRGDISALFGNITLVGHEIVQAGSLTTSTSVTQNGSIRLLARDSVGFLSGANAKAAAGEEPKTNNQYYLLDYANGRVSARVANATDEGAEVFTIGQQGGNLVLAAGSVTEVLLDGSDARTLTPDQTFLPSRIEAAAATIHVEGSESGTGADAGARLSAKGGTIALTAVETFDFDRLFDQTALVLDQQARPSDRAGLFIGGGAVLDVSGAVAQRSVEDLFIEVELRGDEFANNPLQRDGALRGEKAWVDIRDKVAIADLTGYFGKVGQTLEERAASGGDITLRSGGSLIVKQDAVLDVSGGRVDYAAGVVKESRAVTQGGKSYRLNDAPAEAAYAGLITLNRREAAYTEGKSAGSVELTGHSIALDGMLLGHTVRGERQRNLGDPATDRYAAPKGAKLIVRDAGQHYQPAGSGEADRAAAYGQAQIRFVTGPSTAAAGLAFGDQAGPRLDLSQSLVEAGFSRFDLRSDGRIEIPQGVNLNLAAGGEFKASGRQIVVGGNITTPGGGITLTTRDMSQVSGFPTEAKYSTLTVQAGASLSTAGRWINDPLATAPADLEVKAVNGGGVTLDSAYDLVVEADANLNVSGGARLKGDGKLEAGNAGTIKLSTGRHGLLLATDAQDSSLFLEGTLSAYALGKGGRLEVNTSKLLFGAPFAADSRDWSRAQRLAAGQVGAAFDAGIVDRGGFFDFSFSGRDGLTVADNVDLSPDPVSWTLDGVRGYRLRPSGGDLGQVAQALVLHADRRAAPTSLSLATRSVTAGDLLIGDGASLRVDPQGSISLESWRQLTVLGTLEARGGLIRLTRPATTNDNAGDGMVYSTGLQSRSIFLGTDSRLLAGGATKLDAATRAALDAGLSAGELLADGRYRGQVLDGGQVEIEAGQGYLITRPGALIDVSGATDTLSAATADAGSLAYRARALGSAGGRVSLTAREGMILDGDYAAAGGQGATGGIFLARFADARNNTDPWQASVMAGSAEKTAVLGARELTLYQSDGTASDQFAEYGISEADYLAGRVVLDPVEHNGRARLDLKRLEARHDDQRNLDLGGFGSWYLLSQDRLVFEDSITATVANQLRLDAPELVARATRAGAQAIDLTAAALQIGSQGIQKSLAAATGNATFNAHARDIGLVGKFAWSGFAESTFSSGGELHFDSMPDGNAFEGAMRSTGQVTFEAARLSPSTYSHFTVDLADDPVGKLTLTRPASTDTLGTNLSAAGSLTFRANQILHEGTVEAPLGQILFTGLDAVDADGNSLPGSVTLAARSRTSVAADAVLPLGQTSQSGRDWEFQASFWNPSGGGILSATLDIAQAPTKSIRVEATNSKIESVEIAPGIVQQAEIDLSGGGEAVAWEFTPGPGGKVDLLANATGKEPTVFAILPDWNGNFAPQDAQNQAYYNVSNPHAKGTSTYYDSIPSLKPGDQISLADNPLGLSGRYTLLPAQYALLPGAVLVTVKTNQDAVVADNLRQADGSWLVSGTRMAANADGTYTAYSQQPQTFELATQATVLQRAKYNTTTASGFFYDNPGAQLPGDAGRLSVVGRSSLTFDPAVLGRREENILASDGRYRAGRGAELDLAALKLEVIDAGTTASGAGWTSLDKDTLNNLGVSSLLLGGVRQVEADGTTRIDTVADELRIATSVADPEAPERDAFKAPELLLAAGEKVTIAAGSLVMASGDAPAGDYVTDGDGAFARIAGGEQARLGRTGEVTRARGDFLLEDGATVSGRALIFDATHDNRLKGTLSPRNAGEADGSGGALAIGASRINVVGDDSTPADGLTLDNDQLAAFGDLDQLRLTSYSTFDLYGPAVLGSASLKELVIDAAGIAGHGAAGDTAAIRAQRVSFENSSPEAAAFAPGAKLGKGDLDVTAETVTFGGNATEAMRDAEKAGFALRGFSEVAVTASKPVAIKEGDVVVRTEEQGEVRFAGRGVTRVDNDDGDGETLDSPVRLTLDAGRVVAAGAADQLLVASGDAVIRGGGNQSDYTELGGALELRADAVQVGASMVTPEGEQSHVGGRLLAPAGRLSLTATGAGGGVTVKKDGLVAADGVSVAFADTTVAAPGGHIILAAQAGDVGLEAGARVSVLAATGGDAGQVELLAPSGQVTAAAGTLQGRADASVAGTGQAELKVDARTVNLDAMTAAVRETLTDGTLRQHFTGRWDVRRRDGGLDLTQSLTAYQVRLAADNGGVTIGDGSAATTVDASGGKGGGIELYARNGAVTLKTNAKLLAMATEVIDNVSNAGTRGQGGQVILGAAGGGGRVVTEANSQIDVGAAEGSLAKGGEVVFRADASESIARAEDLNIRLAGGILGASEVSAELVSHYTGTGLGNGDSSGETLGLGSIQADLDALYGADNVAKLRKNLGFAEADATRHLRAGVEIVTPDGGSGDFSIDADLDFNALRFQGEPGVLTLRAAGDLKVNGTLSDGFSQANTKVATDRDAQLNAAGDSWSYRLVAGADTDAAAPTAVLPFSGDEAASGDIVVAANKVVRTGTGFIQLAARQDVVLLDRAAVYTAGHADDSFPYPATDASGGPTFKALAPGENGTGKTPRNRYPTDGGDLDVSAGGGIRAVKTGELTEWLLHYSAGYDSTQWWPRIASFQQGFAALGGGDIRLTAGGDITDVLAAIPTSGRVPGQDGEARVDLARINGGGDLLVEAAGAVRGGLFYAESGRLVLRAGTLAATESSVPRIALGNTDAQVISGETAVLGSVFNPLMTKVLTRRVPDGNGNIITIGSSTTLDTYYRAHFATYGEDSGLSLMALTGDISLEPDLTTTDNLAPGNLRVAALQGDIVGQIAQYPALNGQLDLLARDNIELSGLTQHDLPESRLPTLASPNYVFNPAEDDPFTSTAANLMHTSDYWHQDDHEPSRIVSLTGDIGLADAVVKAQFNEPVRVEAAGDIRNLTVVSQHVHDDDVTAIHAGGDLVLLTAGIKGVSGKETIQVNGPGRLEVIAGGDIDLGSSLGIITRGNLENPYLPEGGADIQLLAGATPDYDGFRDYLGVDETVADTVLTRRFFELLRDKGRAALAGGGEASYAEGREAIRALFPATAVSGGDISFFYSQVKTEQGGDIDLLAPGGGVTVGIANPSADLSKAAAEQGLFTVRGGDILTFVRDDFLVNQSRVFTLDGGDILVWADLGSIDAGSGAKTVSATPPPVLVIRNGQIVLDTANSVAGSGIGTLASRPDTPASDLDLFAPQGAIDAGDAGLRSTGNVFLGATQVLNSTNIQVGGVAAGVPVATTGLAGLSGATSPTESAASADDVTKSISDGAAKNDQAAQEMKQALAAFRPSFITVEVLGFGDGSASIGGDCRREGFKTEDDYRRCVREQQTRG